MSCKLSNWSKWSACTNKCGSGVQVRSRTIAAKAKYGGKKCVGANRERKSCEGNNCRNIPGMIVTVLYLCFLFFLWTSKIAFQYLVIYYALNIFDHE